MVLRAKPLVSLVLLLLVVARALVRFCVDPVVAVVAAFNVRQRLPGIWRLTISESLPLPYQQQQGDLLFRSRLENLFLTNGDNKKRKNENDDGEGDNDNMSILLALNEDGSFRQCTDDKQCLGAALLSGCWDLRYDDDKDVGGNNQKLVLAFDRQQQLRLLEQDVTLEGSVVHDRQQSQQRGSILLHVEGQVFQGRFMYPTKHPSFFDQPLVHRQAVGPFSLQQTLATFAVVQSFLPPTTTQQQKDNNDDDESKKNQTSSFFQAADFHSRSFYMTIEPVQYSQSGKKNNKQEDDPLWNLPVDIRAMPITFYSNSTFQAWGTNKILRGRFMVSPQDQLLTFEVSLFGAGRSLKGSVWSEGIGLSHEDQRSYIGTIHQGGQGRLFVEGYVTFGSDLGTDARPEPVGYFVMTETKDENPGLLLLLEDEDENDDDLADDSDHAADGEVDSVFQ